MNALVTGCDLIRSTGDSYDTTIAESTIGLYKTENIWRRAPWTKVETFESATIAWVDWNDNKRLLRPIGDIPPAEFAASYHDAENGQAMDA